MKKALGGSLADTMRVRALVKLGQQYLYTQRQDTALVLADEAMKLAERLDYKVGVGQALILKGSVYRLTLSEAEGLSLYYKALMVLESTGDQRQLAVCYQLLGFSNFWQQNYPEAYRAYRQCLQLSRETGYTEGVIESLTYLVHEYWDKQDHEGALRASDEVLRLSQESGNERGLGYANSGVAKYWKLKSEQAMKTGQTALVKTYGLKSQRYEALASQHFERVGDFGAAGDCYNRQADIHIQLKQFEVAADYLQQAWACAEKMKFDDNYMRYYRSMAVLDSARGDYKKALADYKQYVRYKEKLTDLENTRKSIRENFQYELAKKEAVNTAAQRLKDAETESAMNVQRIIRNALIAGSVLLALLIIVLINRYKLKQAIQLERMRSRLSRDLHDDIGSTLSSIHILSRTAQQNLALHNPERMNESLQKISERSQRLLSNMSDIIWNINPGNDTLEEVMNRMREYATTILEAIDVEYSFDFPNGRVDCALSMEVKNNMYLIFKESVNNLAKYSGARKAFFRLTCDERNIRVLVQDDGAGFDTRTVEYGRGLHNMKHRAQEVKGAWQVSSSPGSGTMVEYSVPRYCGAPEFL